MREAELLFEASEPHAAPASEEFFDELWRLAEQRQRVAARRWRRAAAALAVVALASLTTAAVFASGRSGAAVVDQTWSCAVTPTITGVPRIEMHASVDTPRTTAFFQLTVMPDASTEFHELTQLSFFHRPDSFTVDEHRCSRSKAVIPFGTAKLVPNGVVTTSFVGGVGALCATGASIIFHVRATLAHGTPTRARVAIRTGRKPVAYVDWSPKRISTYFERGCPTYSQ
jgi:hypothetical protein